MIDGYTHCGLSKYRPIAEVRAVLASAGVERAVLCQHLGEYDNHYLAEVVAGEPAKFAAICLVDPVQESATSELEDWQATGRFRGVRLVAQWLSGHESLWARAVELGLILVVYAPQGMAHAAPTIGRFAAAHPDARLVVTHLGNPQVSPGEPLANDLLRLAAVPGVFIQLSGLGQFCEYPYLQLAELVRSIVAEFGASRIYWGSNFPVCGDRVAYERELELVKSGPWGLNSEQIHSILTQTAAALWFPGQGGPEGCPAVRNKPSREGVER